MWFILKLFVCNKYVMTIYTLRDYVSENKVISTSIIINKYKYIISYYFQIIAITSRYQ